MAKKYKGMRDEDICVVHVYNNADVYSLPTALNTRNHSPAGFEWGYGGSGPSQLALAILIDLIGEAGALSLYQDFKFHFIANLPHYEWEINESEIREWLSEKSNGAKHG